MDELIAKLEAAVEHSAPDQELRTAPEDGSEEMSRLSKIMSGNVGRKVSQSLLEDRDIAGLASLWQMGVEVPWAQVTGGGVSPACWGLLTRGGGPSAS